LLPVDLPFTAFFKRINAACSAKFRLRVGAWKKFPRRAKKWEQKEEKKKRRVAAISRRHPAVGTRR